MQLDYAVIKKVLVRRIFTYHLSDLSILQLPILLTHFVTIFSKVIVNFNNTNNIDLNPRVNTFYDGQK